MIAADRYLESAAEWRQSALRMRAWSTLLHRLRWLPSPAREWLADLARACRLGAIEADRQAVWLGAYAASATRNRPGRCP